MEGLPGIHSGDCKADGEFWLSGCVNGLIAAVSCELMIERLTGQILVAIAHMLKCLWAKR